MLRGFVLITLAAMSWGTTGSVMTVLAGAGTHPLVTGAARMAVAAVLLVAGGKLAGGLSLPPAERWRPLAMGACMAGYQVAYFTAVTLTGIAVTALLAICSAPVLIAGLAPVVLGERLTARTLAALALAVAGAALLTGDPRAAGVSAARGLAGATLAFGAGLAYALYVLIAKAALARAAPLPVTAWTFVAAALFLLPTLAAAEAPLAQVERGWPWLVYLGTVATAGAYALYALGLRRVPAAIAGIMTLAEPLTATALGVIIFGERLGTLRTLGAVLMLAATTVVLSPRPPAPRSRG